MPRRDQTGPMGEGALTGRQMGSCSDNKTASFYGFKRGRGRRFSCQNNSMNLQEEKDYLKKRLEQIEKDLNQ